MSGFSSAASVSFGRGTVGRIMGGRTVEVVFDRHGRKTLHLDYAKLEKIE